MNRHRATVVLCMLSAVLAGAIGPQSSSAAFGTTVATCKKKAVEGGEGFSKEHCKPEDAVGTNAKYEHVSSGQLKTSTLITNETTGGAKSTARLKGTAGEKLTLELQATEVSGSGWEEVSVEKGNDEFYVHGDQTITFTGVTVAQPAGKGCKVYNDVSGKGVEGRVDTTPLKATTTEKESLTLEPSAGTPFARFIIEGCEGAFKSLNQTYTVEGSVACTPNGTTLGCTHEQTTAQKTLTLNGENAGLDLSATVKGKGTGSTYTPLGITTFNDPVSGTTAFTCKNIGAPSGEFTKAHCKSSDSGTGNYSHVAIAAGTPTELEVTNEGTGSETATTSTAKLKATVNGIQMELRASSARATGTVENGIGTSGEHSIVASSQTTYTEIEVAKPAGKGCQVYTDIGGGEKGEKGVLHTNVLETVTEGQGDAGKLKPAEEGSDVLATFITAGCTGSEALEGLNKTYELNGSVTCQPDGATVNCGHTEMTEAQTLLFNHAVKVGIEVSTTFKGRANNTEPFTPLSPTTVKT
jgi:hypothetical protein